MSKRAELVKIESRIVASRLGVGGTGEMIKGTSLVQTNKSGWAFQTTVLYYKFKVAKRLDLVSQQKKKW